MKKIIPSTPTGPAYTYTAKVLKVHDGDTITIDVDLGMSIRRKETVRLAGINSPELPTKEGKAAAEYLRGLLGEEGLAVIVTTHKDEREKFGRLLAWVWLLDGTVVVPGHVNGMMVDKGHAKEYWP